MDYHKERIQRKVLQHIKWVAANFGECTISELRNRFNGMDVLPVCMELLEQNQIQRKGFFELSFTI